MFKAIYTQQFALSLTHLIAKQIQNFVTRNRKTVKQHRSKFKTPAFFTAVVQKWKTYEKLKNIWKTWNGQHLVHTVKLSFKNIRDHFRAFSCLLPDSQNVGISYTRTFSEVTFATQKSHEKSARRPNPTGKRSPKNMQTKQPTATSLPEPLTPAQHS